MPFLVACGSLVSFMIGVKAYFKLRGIKPGEETLIGKYTDKNIDLGLLSKKIQDFLVAHDLGWIKLETTHDQEFKEKIITKRRTLGYRNIW